MMSPVRSCHKPKAGILSNNPVFECVHFLSRKTRKEACFFDQKKMNDYNFNKDLVPLIHHLVAKQGSARLILPDSFLNYIQHNLNI